MPLDQRSRSDLSCIPGMWQKVFFNKAALFAGMNSRFSLRSLCDPSLWEVSQLPRQEQKLCHSEIPATEKTICGALSSALHDHSPHQKSSEIVSDEPWLHVRCSRRCGIHSHRLSPVWRTPERWVDISHRRMSRASLSTYQPLILWIASVSGVKGFLGGSGSAN